jgi:hypothetical protein
MGNKRSKIRSKIRGQRKNIQESDSFRTDFIFVSEPKEDGVYCVKENWVWIIKPVNFDEG